MSDELARWAAQRAETLIARAEAEAVAELKGALLRAVRSRERPEPAKPAVPAPRAAVPSRPSVWTYCVARAGDPLPVGIPGLEPGTTVERIEHHGLAAAVSPVPGEEFSEDALKGNLNDIAWLERAARAHETVLERASELATIVPLRMCTIFTSELGVRRMLEETEDALDAALDRLSGREEWAVKLLVDREALEAACGVDEASPATGTGAAYMLQRRAERDRRAAADNLGRELADDVHARLQDWATDAIVNPPQSRELSGHVGEMLLNGAYLIERSRAGELRALVADLQERHRAVGARLELSGPLPPFNFVPRSRGGSAP